MLHKRRYVWLRNSTPRYSPKKNEKIFLFRDCTWMFTAVLLMVVKNWKRPKYPPIAEWIHIIQKWKKGTTDLYNNTDESQKHAEQKQARHKGEGTVWVHSDETPKKTNLIYTDRKHTSGCLRPKVKVEDKWQEAQGNFLEWGSVLCLGCGGHYTAV